MKAVQVVLIGLLFIVCSADKGVHFEKTSYLSTLEKAKQLDKNILVDVFSDG